jgi:hypothetical protein
VIVSDCMDQDTLRSLVHYDPESGIFTWLPRKPLNKHHNKIWNNRFAGKQITRMDGYGYIQCSVTVNGKKYRHKIHRLAWLYVYGVMPVLEIDHINQVRTDNRITNLRLATKQENQYNVTNPRKHNVSGIKGSKWCPRDGNYMARITVDGKEVYLGKFATAEEAHRAYVDAHIRYAKEFSPYSSGAVA